MRVNEMDFSFSLPPKKLEINFDKVALALILVYSLVRFFYAIIPVFNFDESWFTGHMEEDFTSQATSFLAYSPLFWMYGHAILAPFKTFNHEFGMIFLRLTFLGCYIASIYLLYRRMLKENEDQIFSLLGLLALVTMPLSFFSGKLISPEFLQLILFTVALNLLLDNKNQILAWLIAGVAAGLKLHSLHFLVFLFLIKFYRSEKRQIKDFFILARRSIPLALLGVLISNFPIIFDYQETIKSFEYVGAGSNITQAGKAFFGIRGWEAAWGEAYNANDMLSHDESLLVFIFSSTGLFLFFSLFIFLRQYVLGGIALVSLVLAIALVESGYYSDIWSHISYFPILISIAFWGKPRKYASLIVAGIIIANSINSYRVIDESFTIRRTMAKEVKSSSANTLCINALLAKEKPDIYSFGVLTHWNGSKMSYIAAPSLEQSNPKVFINTYGTLGIDSSIATVKKIKDRPSILISLSPVATKYNPESYAPEIILEKFRQKIGGRSIKKLPGCGAIKNYIIKSYDK